MNYKICDLSQKKEWKKYLDSLPISQQDIYFTPEYYELYETKGDGKAQCFVFKDNGDIALYPFLINSVNKLGYKLKDEYYDIQGAYGYNGVVSSSYNMEFRRKYFNLFTEYCKENNIIAEFTRFNPILENHKFSNYLNVIKNNQNIILDLSIKDIWMDSYEHPTRKNINKAIRNELKVKYFSGFEITNYYIRKFFDIYMDTMTRNSADDFYYFNKEYFQEIARKLLKNALYFFTFKDEIAISCELVLLSKKIGYSFLGGTLSKYFEFRPNDILKHEIINVLKQRQYNYFCLGGGSSVDDGIFNYKKKFAKNGIFDFYIGKKIHNQQTYDKVVKQWEEKYPEKKEKYKNYLLKYRK